MSCTIHVAMATDANHLAYLPGVWRSLVRNASAEIVLHLLVRGLSSDQEHWLQDVAGQEGLRLTLTATDKLLEGLDVTTPHYITRVSLDRLFLPRLFGELERLVYLDTDILVLGDVRELEAHPTGPTGLAAKATIHPRFRSFRNALRSWDPRGLERISWDTTEDWPFFNSGVLVMDLERLRATRFAERALEYIAQYQCNDNLTASLCVRGAFMRLPAEWNVFVGQDHDRITTKKLLHWIGGRKPWNDENAPLRDVWMAYQASEPCQGADATPQPACPGITDRG